MNKITLDLQTDQVDLGDNSIELTDLELQVLGYVLDTVRGNLQSNPETGEFVGDYKEWNIFLDVDEHEALESLDAKVQGMGG